MYRHLLVARRNGDLTRTHTWERTVNFFHTTWTILTELYRIFNFFSDHTVCVYICWNRTYDDVFSFWIGLDFSSSLDLEEKETALGACHTWCCVKKNKKGFQLNYSRALLAPFVAFVKVFGFLARISGRSESYHNQDNPMRWVCHFLFVGFKMDEWGMTMAGIGPKKKRDPYWYDWLLQSPPFPR